MRKLILVPLFALMVIALALRPAGLPTTAAQEALPDAEGGALATYILETNPYTEWYAVTSGMSGFLPSASPHGPVVRVFVNDIAAEALMAPDFDGQLPYGSILVKEAYQNEGATPDNPGDVTGIVTMYKVEGFNPDAGDWFWVAMPPDGSAVGAEGAVSMCIECHSAEGNVDYALVFALDIETELMMLHQMATLPDADGAALVAYLLETNPYTEWSYVVGDVDLGFLPSASPHGPVVRVFLNDIAAAWLAEHATDDQEMGMEEVAFPYGSILVKEGYQNEGASPDDPGDVTGVVAMYKVEGFNAEAGDWFWLAFPPDGSEVYAEGAVSMCIDCHSSEGQFDYTLLGFDGDLIIRHPLPEADGAALLAYITEIDPYTAWGAWPSTAELDFGAFLPSEAVHGTVVRIFVNDIALNAAMAADFDGVLPPGSIVVKEGYGGTLEDPGELTALTVQYKVEGFNPAANDWFWLSAPGGAEVRAAGAVEGCVNCHANASATDYLFFAFGGLTP